MGAAAVPSASSLENMAGILIALLILLIAAFHDTQKVQWALLRSPVSDDDCLARALGYLKIKALSPESQYIIGPDTKASNSEIRLLFTGLFHSLFLSWLLCEQK